MGFDDLPRPKLTFDKDHKVRGPVIEKPLDGLRRIKGCKLVQGPGRNALAHQPGGCGRDRRDQEMEAGVPASHLADKSEDRECLSHADRVKPDQRTRGARLCRLPHPFGYPHAGHLRPPHLSRNMNVDQRGRKSRQPGIDPVKATGVRRGHQPPVWLM